ncbi:hypothetical protein [Photobacterium atrarenae]|uniref:DUF1496 domain-containing protein n=1 Tax=Photobacterium atrarenae TaxID=865757 RepID=A0ABY5GF96_9GAMM|nr:hypothetical protein [Photobacterium atrarenae]UTV27058.1 hypothetical protein NNL38_12005 [Photobacterium atrarenae]
MKAFVTSMVVVLMSLSSAWALASNQGSGGQPSMPIYRCVIELDGKTTQQWVPHHICQQRGGKTVF